MSIVKKKIDQLFITLRERGFLTAEGEDHCAACAIERLYDVIESTDYDRVAFYNQEDLEVFEDLGIMSIGFGARYNEQMSDYVFDEAARLCGAEILKHANHLGLDIEWDGSYDSRIIVRGVCQ